MLETLLPLNRLSPQRRTVLINDCGEGPGVERMVVAGTRWTAKDGFFDGESFHYLDGRQAKIHLIPGQ